MPIYISPVAVLTDPEDDECPDCDDLAWNAFVQRHYSRIFAIPRSVGLPRADADDIAQETFIALFQLTPKPRNVVAWLCGTAKNKSADVWKQRFGHIAIREDVEWHDDFENRVELKEILSQAFGCLTQKELLTVKTMLTLWHPTDRKIANFLGKSPESVKKMRQRAFKKLRDALS